MNTEHWMLCLYWAFFCALHSLLAAQGWKRLMQRIMGRHFKFYRLYYTLFAFASLGAVVAFQVNMASPFLFAPTFFSKTAACAVGIAGIVVMAICIRKYFIHLSGLKSLYRNDEQAANQLQITGIHRYVRHPLYTGTFLAIWGLWLLVPQLSLLLANVIITAYTLTAIGWEEQKLIAEFGDAYRRYQRSVPRLFPMPRKTGLRSF